MRPSQVRQKMSAAQPAAATAMATNETWLGVIGVGRSIQTITAAGGRETHSVQKLSRFFFDCR